MEAKLSYLVKFVKESIEEDKHSGEATFAMTEVRLLSAQSRNLIMK